MEGEKGKKQLGFADNVVTGEWGMGSKKTERRVYVKNRADFDFGENSEMGGFGPEK